MNENVISDQSPEWNHFYDLVNKAPGQRLAGFPFATEFPKLYIDQRYEIILVSGAIEEAKVDDSGEYMSEGLEWKKIIKK
jgi:hypothetical protein